MVGSGHSFDHSMCLTGHPGGVFSHHDSTKEASIRGHIQPQLTGGSWGQTGNGQRPQSASRREAYLRLEAFPHRLTSKGCILRARDQIVLSVILYTRKEVTK